MKNLVMVLLCVLMSSVWANISIGLSPSFPVAGESFNVIFNVETEEDEEPFLSFDPSGVEVIGREMRFERKVIFSNNRATSKKTYIYTYEMRAPVARIGYLRNITASIGTKTLNHKDVSIKISRENKESGDTFVVAEVSNDNPYIGQGIDVRYYLYTRDRSLVSVEIKEFPKLNGFLKRFHKLKETEEVVQYNGQVFRRYLKYSARLFPEKTGELRIDPLKLSLRYQKTSNRRGSFGSIFGQMRTVARTKGSKVVKIKVRSLPAIGVPKTFIGLVGKHNAKIQIARNKYLVNEPIEVRLEITGEGALEKLEPPKIWQSELLEDFDTKSEYVDIDTNSGRKIFDYTYLVRSNGVIDGYEKKLHYFDVETESYMPMILNIDKLTLSGSSGQVLAKSNAAEKMVSDSNEKVQDLLTSEKTKIVAPIFQKLDILSYIQMPKWLLVLLITIYALLLGYFILIKSSLERKIRSHDVLLKDIYKKGLTYKKLSNYILSLKKKERDTDIKSIIKVSKLKNEDKEYFLKLIHDLEQEKFFDGQDNGKKILIKKKSFESLRSLMS